MKTNSRQLRTGERLWRLRKQRQQVDAVLQEHGAAGVELQFFYNGELAYGQHCLTRDLAIAKAAEKRQELERSGWTAHW